MAPSQGRLHRLLNRRAALPDYPTGTIALTEAALAARLEFLGLTPKLLGQVAYYRPACEAAMEPLIDAFYAKVAANPVTRGVLDRHSTVEKQRPLLTRYVLTMFSGRMDDAYIAMRRRVGAVHSRIDLDSNWFVAMYDTIAEHVVTAVAGVTRNEAELAVFRRAFGLVLHADIALVTDALANTRRDEIAAVNADNDRMLREVSAVLGRLSERDLTARVEGEFSGAHAEIKRAFNEATAALEAALRGVYDGSRDISRAADQISSTASMVAAGASSQRATIDTVAAEANSLLDAAQHVAKGSLVLRDESATATQVARAGLAELTALAAALQAMCEAADQTAQIVRSIDEIAFQTNLLALNASVEAARAGDAGRAFGVVAEEVRNLAKRAADAARRTTHLIQQSRDRAHASTTKSAEVAELLQRVVESIESVHGAVAEISDGAVAQQRGTANIQRAMMRIGDVTQDNAAAAEQSAAASNELAGQSAAMEGAIAQFRLAGVERPTAAEPRGRGAGPAWKHLPS
jgi:methyl-accepting chemotaxis protein